MKPPSIIQCLDILASIGKLVSEPLLLSQIKPEPEQ
jgi:hypothetical protein